MGKIKVTKQQRANALEALNVMWPSVPPENVARRLGSYRQGPGKRATCKTVACFGGWCAAYPPFMRQGVRMASGGYPELVEEEKYGFHVAGHLFGAMSLFNPRNDWRDGSGTDHEIVSKRLRKLIRNSVVVDA